MTPRAFAAVPLSVAALLGLTACDRGARRDLPNDSQDRDESDALVGRMPDQFPNVVHKCLPDSTTGIWSLTRDDTWIVYNDPECGGTGTILVLDNVPGANVTSGGGDR